VSKVGELVQMSAPAGAEAFKTLVDEFSDEAGKHTDLCAQVSQEPDPYIYENVTGALRIALEELKKKNTRAHSYKKLWNTDLSVQLPRFKDPHKITNNGTWVRLWHRGNLLDQTKSLGICHIRTDPFHPIVHQFVVGKKRIRVEYCWNADGNECMASTEVKPQRH
jgi:hypothetical protein